MKLIPRRTALATLGAVAALATAGTVPSPAILAGHSGAELRVTAG